MHTIINSFAAVGTAIGAIFGISDLMKLSSVVLE